MCSISHFEFENTFYFCYWMNNQTGKLAESAIQIPIHISTAITNFVFYTSLTTNQLIHVELHSVYTSHVKTTDLYTADDTASTVWLAIYDRIVTNLASPDKTGIPSPKNKIKIITLGRSVHSGQFSNLGWELRILGPISWFHFCCSQNPSPSSSTWWTEDLGGSILISLKPATRSRKHQRPWYGFKREHTVHLCKLLNQESKT